MCIVSLSLRCAEAVMKSSWTPSQRCCDRRMPLCLCWTHETHTHAHTHPDTATEAVTHTLIHKLWCVTPLLLLYLNLNICNLGAFPCHKSRVKPSLENWIWEILWVLLSRLWCSSTSLCGSVWFLNFCLLALNWNGRPNGTKWQVHHSELSAACKHKLLKQKWDRHQF